MKEVLIRFENSISKILGQKLTNITQDQECEEYSGFNIEINQLKLKFRKAKITPKKAGQFVTLWRRNSEKQTEPFNETDNFDFYIIAAEQEEKFGFFIFPKNVLIVRQILTTNQKEGKRGFRVYPDWTKTENKQAEKTQTWQTNYFINLTNNEQKNIEKLKAIINV